MKQLVTTEKVIGESTFYIRPFPAFTAANISGDLAALVTPLIGALAPLVVTKDEQGNKKDGNIMDAEIDDAIPALSKAMSGLSGDQFERLMKKLLTDHQNISVVSEEATNGKAVVMDYDLANEVFCGEVQDMYILCWEVIKINFKGFFKKIGARFGGLLEAFQQKTASENTETST